VIEFLIFVSFNRSVTIFTFKDYKLFVNNWIQRQPQRGRGLIGEFGKATRTSTTLMSQIFRGKKNLSLDAAEAICARMGLTEIETQHFFLLVQYSQAKTKGLKEFLSKQIVESQKRALRKADNIALDEGHNNSVFYSSWIYAGMRALTTLPQIRTAEDIAAYLQIPRVQVQKVLEFLVAQEFVAIEEGELVIGPRQPRIHADSPLVRMHHQNWRARGLEKMQMQNRKDLFYTGVMTISEVDAQQVRKRVGELIENVGQIVQETEGECTRCVNIDYFQW
jgi:uncharacterized protein (TIGR02147 family)